MFYSSNIEPNKEIANLNLCLFFKTVTLKTHVNDKISVYTILKYYQLQCTDAGVKVFDWAIWDKSYIWFKMIMSDLFVIWSSLSLKIGST